MSKSKQLVIFGMLSIFIFSCKKDEKIEVVIPSKDIQASAVFNFTAKVNNLPFIKNTKWYANANGDSFTVSKFNYYISNIKFKREDGSLFAEDYSYHVIKHVEGVTSFTVQNLPEGNYNSIEFLIGVDSLKNVSGSQTGDLSPDSLMFWDWSTGYIFFKLEGNYKNTTTPNGDTYSMHIGGFSGEENFLRKCNFNLTNPIVASKNKSSKVFYNVSINEIFANPLVIDFNTYNVVGGGRKAQEMADNYKDMFVIDRIEN